jgi:hypothetical protein
LIKSTRVNLGDIKAGLFGADSKFDDQARLALPQSQEDQSHSLTNA